MIRVLPYGAFYNRQPLAYGPVLDLVQGRIALVDDVRDADIVTISHHKDLELFGTRLWKMLAAQPGLRIVLLSEEPFWDTCWSPDPFSRDRVFDTPYGPVPHTVVNHFTSPLWRTPGVPYFLLTDPRYIANLRPRFARNAGRSAADWVRQFRTAEIDAAFVGEKRTLPRHAPAWPDQNTRGLSVYRSDVTRTCTGSRILRIGKGWSDTPPRQDLTDWHAEKLAHLDLRCRYVGAFENTHQMHYVSEKIFDAFALGAIPLYFAAPDHAVFGYIGAGGWLNLFEPRPKAPAFNALQPIGQSQADAYAATQERLATVFTDPATVPTALDRLAEGLLAEFRTILGKDCR